MAAARKTRTPQSRSSGRTQNYGQRILDDALAVGGTLLKHQKNVGAERLQMLADATRNYGKSLTDIPGVGGYVVMAAESVSAFADYVVESDLEEMVADASAFARRQPLATLALAVAAGLVATFVIRSQSGLDFGTRPGPARGRPKRIARKVAARRSVSTKRGRRASGNANGTAQPATQA